jgi:hypothetical protein
MPEMPQRPREHVLGDEAQDAFKSLLPTHWIYRQKASDYGIDGEVELVSPTGQLTGRLFYVQLKGTEQESLTEALKIRLKITTLNYFRALDLPVLIVRYHGKTKNVYARWFDSIENTLPEGGQDTVCIRLSDEDALTPDRSAAIPGELEGIRLVKFSKLTLPVDVEFNAPECQIRQFALAELISVSRSLVSPNLVSFRSTALITVEIGTESTQIRIGVAHKLSIPTEILFRRDLRVFAANVLTAIGVALGRVQQVRAAAMLIISSAKHGDLLSRFPFGIEAAFYLADDNRTAEALDIASFAIARGNSLEGAKSMT